MKKALALTSLAALALPFVALAQEAVTDINEAGNFIITLINEVFIPVIFAVAFIVFLWGAFQTFILGANDEDVKTNGKNLMLYGLIGFFVMVSIWGLVNVFRNSVALDEGVELPETGFDI